MAESEGLLDSEQHYTVSGYSGIAFYYAGDETKPDADTEWTGIEEPTGMVKMVMVGDDREHIIDPADCTVIPEEAYCSSCGQIGCTADGRER